MSVNINFRPTSNETKWKSVKNGDFAVIEGTQDHPIPSGLYRIFVVQQEMDPPAEGFAINYLLVPMFDGPFSQGMFPYMLTESPFPSIKQVVNKVHIEVEVT